MTHAIIPGSFDPVTLGHFELIRRAAALFDTVTAVILVNPDKKYRFTAEERFAFLQASLSSLPNVTADKYDGMLVDYLALHPGAVVVKGIRNDTDLSYEMTMAATNRTLDPRVETLFLPTDPAYTYVSSTLVRTLLDHGKDARAFLPEEIRNIPPFLVR